MAGNKKQPGAGASTSFRRDEIDAMRQLFTVLYRGGDPRAILRSPGVIGVYKKFKRMSERVQNVNPAPSNGSNGLNGC